MSDSQNSPNTKSLKWYRVICLVLLVLIIIVIVKTALNKEEKQPASGDATVAGLADTPTPGEPAPPAPPTVVPDEDCVLNGCALGTCDTATKRCIECRQGADCKAAEKPICSNGKCVGCNAQFACYQGICEASTGRCVECLSNANCTDPDKAICSNGKCSGCGPEVACATGTCDVRSGRCVECWRNADCTDPARGMCANFACVACSASNCGEMCDPATGKCVLNPNRPPVVLPPPPPIRPPSVGVTGLVKTEKAPDIRNYAVDAHVTGLYARVSTEFTIHNDNGRVLEGELEFPLPDGAVVSGYAIDINGVMTPAAVVEKERARIAFEAEVKRGVDPGLVEQVKGNEYRTRIYPIPARGSRRIRVEYVTPLVIAPNGDAALGLPMPDTKLDTRDVTISVSAPGLAAPAVGGLGDTRFVTSEPVWRVESHETNVTPSDNVLVAMPHLPEVVSAAEYDRGDYFFAASILVGEVPQDAEMPEMPDSWRIIWDASGSRSADDIAKAREFLNALPEYALYELHVFRNTLEEPQHLASREELLAVIDGLAYDGGTDFEPLKAVAAEAFEGPTLFFTDGMDTMNSAIPEFGAKAVALVTGDLRDVASMNRICGGRVVNLGYATAEEAMRQVLIPPAVVSGVTGTGISDVQGIGMAATGRVTILGRMRTPGGSGTVILSDGREFPVQFQSVNIPDGNTLSAAWAARRVDELSPRADESREELLAIGRHFSIVSPVTSMIVFERLDQWLRYDIEPPEALAELHSQWVARRQSEASRKESENWRAQEWANNLSREWNNRIAWWENPVPRYEPPKEDRFQRVELLDDDGPSGGDLMQAAPMPQRAAERQLEAMREEAMKEAAAPARERANAAPKVAKPKAAGGSAKAAGGRAPERRAPAMAQEPRPSAIMADQEAMADTDAAGNNGGGSDTAFAGITVQAWNPDMPYLKAIEDAGKVFQGPDSRYNEYLKQRKQYGRSPAFYLDCASMFLADQQLEIGRRILSNLSEMRIDDVALLRVYAWRLREAGDYDTAITILRKVAKIRADEAVSWRDLALTLDLRARRDHSVADAEEALSLYHKAAFTPWIRNDALWTSIIALEEFNEFAAWCNRQSWPDRAPVIPTIEDRFRRVLDTDVRIAMSWDADSTDIDMHVIEPSGEEVYYAHNRSRSGGMISHDVTQGYGPEEYFNKTAPSGDYRVRTKYFASHQQKLLGPATITLTIFTNWGRENQTYKTTSLRLDRAKDIVDVGSVHVDGTADKPKEP